MERLGTEEETPVAPHEVRELLARLNEGSVEALPPSETRTLGGLAVETGIPIDRLQDELYSVRGQRPKKPMPWLAPAALLAVTLGIGGWLWSATIPKEIPLPPALTTPIVPLPSDRGLVGLDSVTYGPDGGQYKVEPTFQPTEAIKPGLSISADIRGVLWGAGDHRAATVREPLTDKEEAQLARSIEELLRHVRNRAAKREIPPGKPMALGDPEFLYEGAAHSVTIYIQAYQGSGMTQVPIPPVGADDEDFKRLSKAAAKRVTRMFQQHLKFMSR